MDTPERPSSPRDRDADGSAVHRADYDPAYDPAKPVICEVCGGSMDYTASCKLVCRNCGYVRDCSDP